MRVAYHSRSRASLDDEAALGATYHDSLPALLAASDIVSLHCPGGAATRHLLNRQALACMKPTAILINTARGSVVDESALADALSRGVIAAAGLDVYEAEPAVHPALLELENVVLLPHLGSATIQTRTAMGMRRPTTWMHSSAAVRRRIASRPQLMPKMRCSADWKCRTRAASA